jgi:hypothetical protein
LREFCPAYGGIKIRSPGVIYRILIFTEDFCIETGGVDTPIILE